MDMDLRPVFFALMQSLLCACLTHAQETRNIRISGNLDERAPWTSVYCYSAPPYSTFAELDEKASFSKVIEFSDLLGQRRTFYAYFFHCGGSSGVWLAAFYVDAQELGGPAGDCYGLYWKNLFFDINRFQIPTYSIPVNMYWANDAEHTIRVSFAGLTNRDEAAYINLCQDEQNGYCTPDHSLDFDGLLYDDFSLWRPSFGIWAVRTPLYPAHLLLWQQWGFSSDVPVSGDFTGDGRADYVVWRPFNGTWYICDPILTSYYGEYSTGCSETSAIQFGLPGDQPLSADFDADQKGDAVVFRPQFGQWYIRESASADGANLYQPFILQWGLPEDKTLIGYYQPEPTPDLVVWRPSSGIWYIRPLSRAEHLVADAPPIVRQWGLSGDCPIVGDFTGDHVDDLVVWRPSEGNWYICPSDPNFDCSQGTVFQFGLPGDYPLRADFDGDAVSDFAVWRPSEGNLYWRRSSTGEMVVEPFGMAGDIPLGGACH